jgi:hypothetical protein
MLANLLGPSENCVKKTTLLLLKLSTINSLQTLQALKTLQVDSLSGASKIRFFIAKEEMGDLNFLPSSC